MFIFLLLAFWLRIIYDTREVQSYRNSVCPAKFKLYKFTFYLLSELGNIGSKTASDKIYQISPTPTYDVISSAILRPQLSFEYLVFAGLTTLFVFIRITQNRVKFNISLLIWTEKFFPTPK